MKKLPECKHRRRVNGMDMCYAIGCCEIGDMPCECWSCGADPCPKMTTEGVKPSKLCNTLQQKKRSFSHKKQ